MRKAAGSGLAAALLAAVAAAQGPSPIGTWRGLATLADGTEVEIVLTLERPQAGGLAGRLDVPAQAREGLAVSDLAFTAPALAFAVAELPGAPRFAATLSADGARLTGVMTAEASPPPATDVYLVALGADGSVGAVRNLTDRDGYDNQPRFLAGGGALLYTSIRDGQADTYRLDLATGERHPLATTPESEFSPTPMAGGVSYSTVRVEPDGRQRLWRFPLAGGEPELLLPDVAPVGYHAWLDDSTVALFVLGDPPTLRVATLGEPGARVLAEGIGRSLHRAPGGTAVAWVDKSHESEWWIKVTDPASGAVETVGPTIAGSEDFAWTPEGRLLMGAGSKLHRGTPGGGTIAWSEIADLAAAGVTGITRLDVAPDGGAVALVGERPAPPPQTVETEFTLERVP